MAKKSSPERVTLFSALDKLAVISKDQMISKFPKVVVDQTNFRISDIIKRNLAGEQILGVKNLSYDFESSDQEPDFETVNPFNGLDFDLDDLITFANVNQRKIADLQNRLGEIKADLDKSKKEVPAVPAAPAAPVAPAAPGVQ